MSNELKDNQNSEPSGRLDLAAVQEKLKGKSGKHYWRSLEEVAETPEFDQWLEDEFPHRSTLNQLNRRDLLKFMGASMALAGLAGCRGVFMPQEKLVPYVKAPEEMVPGVPLFYASSVVLGGYATGVLVEQRDGRPIKLEGNPEHPASLGALDSISQAELLNLYDPDRLPNVVYKGNISTWELFARALTEIGKQFQATQGEGLSFLVPAISSPTLLASLSKLKNRYPAAQWYRHEPVGRGGLYEGMQAAFGRPCEPVYDLTSAKAILALDSDFVSPTGIPGSLAYARQFAQGRRVRGKVAENLNRLYSIESMPTSTGAMADHRWPVKASQVGQVAAAILASLQGRTGGDLAGINPTHFQAMVDDLRTNAGVVIVGDQHPAEVHAAVAMINEILGARGSRVKVIPPVDGTIEGFAPLSDLVGALNSGSVDTLVILGGNPAYDAPSDFDFAANLAKAKTRIHFTSHDNETSALCDWLLPSTHFLEEWGDAVAFDGSVSMIQPIIQPLFDGRSATEVVAMFLGEPKGSYEIVRDYWRSAGLGGGDFERRWREVIHDGVAVPANPGLPGSPRSVDIPAAGGGTGIEVIFRADPTIYDGRYANNGWLQELPKPMTKMTWDNTIIMSPKTAIRLGLLIDDVVRLTVRDVTVEGGAYVQPGHPDEAVTVHLGYGRTRGGAVATVTGDYGGGFDAYKLRRSDALYFGSDATLEKVGGQMNLATTQTHQPIETGSLGGVVGKGIEGSVIHQTPMDHREVVLEWTVDHFNENIDEILEERQEKTEEFKRANLYPEEIFEWNGQQWAMTIDLNTCISCNACVSACVAENNIPVVGKPAVGRHREMHWIRIDRYYSGTTENPSVVHQPVACVHCEQAPCEPVCPVAATVHSHDGLNQMIYNRCVGTRYCSNNCPYKVRRFNYLNFTDNQLQFAPQTDDKPRRPLLKLLNNPDVTVRGRGVMEKCTYCVQRINQARIEAKKTNRRIRDGEILTACQQACPTQTIVFGDQTDTWSNNNTGSEVSKLRKDPRAYLLLEELNTRPRTSYLAKLRNPNPIIAPATKEGES